MADLTDIFDHGPGRNPTSPPPCELPNRRIEVKLQLKKHINIVLQALQNDLRHHNMDKVMPDPDTKNAITVAGIPPVNGFDKHTVLAMVKRRDPKATLLSCKFLS